MKTNLFQILDVSKIPLKGLTFELTATPQELKMLAERFDLPAIASFKVRGNISGDNVLKVAADIQAQITQICVVTLKKFNTDFKTHFEEFFSENGVDYDAEQDFDIDMGEDVSDIIKNGKLNLGEIIAQQFGLALDPFPRSTDEPFEYIEEQPGQKQNPFSGLKDLLNK